MVERTCGSRDERGRRREKREYFIETCLNKYVAEKPLEKWKGGNLNLKNHPYQIYDAELHKLWQKDSPFVGTFGRAIQLRSSPPNSPRQRPISMATMGVVTRGEATPTRPVTSLRTELHPLLSRCETSLRQLRIIYVSLRSPGPRVVIDRDCPASMNRSISCSSEFRSFASRSSCCCS